VAFRTSTISIAASEVPKTVTVTLVHLNDVYEILPVEGGKSGGLARVATVIEELKAANPALLTARPSGESPRL
jgi:5'-nucleotidase